LSTLLSFIRFSLISRIVWTGEGGGGDEEEEEEEAAAAEDKAGWFSQQTLLQRGSALFSSLSLVSPLALVSSLSLFFPPPYSHLYP